MLRYLCPRIDRTEIKIVLNMTNDSKCIFTFFCDQRNNFSPKEIGKMSTDLNRDFY